MKNILTPLIGENVTVIYFSSGDIRLYFIGILNSYVQEELLDNNNVTYLPRYEIQTETNGISFSLDDVKEIKNLTIFLKK